MDGVALAMAFAVSKRPPHSCLIDEQAIRQGMLTPLQNSGCHAGQSYYAGLLKVGDLRNT